MKNRNLNLVSRITSPTPKWFRIVRNIGLSLTAVGGALVAAPVVLPSALVTLGGYLLLGGTIIGAVSQTAISSEEYGGNSEKMPEKSMKSPISRHKNGKQKKFFTANYITGLALRQAFIMLFYQLA